MPLPTAEGAPIGSLPENTPEPPGQPLAGTWLLTFAEPDQAPAQVVLGEDGMVTYVDVDGNRGAGVWTPGEQQSGVLAIVVGEADASDQPHQIMILRGPIEAETSGDAATLSFTYTVETVDDSGAASEPSGSFAATGQRADQQLIVPTPG
jgi:hypothetical protein